MSDYRSFPTSRMSLRTNVILGALAALLLATTGTVAGCEDVFNPSYRHVKTSEVKWPDGATFKERWQDPKKQFHTSIPLSRGTFCDARGTYLSVNHQDMVLSVLVPDAPVEASSGRPLAMQLAITSLVQVNNGVILPQVYGDPPITCDLNNSEAAYVWDNGVPESLIAEMTQTASKAGWKPIPPGGTSVYPGPAIVVAPDVHFPSGPVHADGARE